MGIFTRTRRYPDDHKPLGRGLTNAEMRVGHDNAYGKAADESLVWIVKQNEGAAGQGALAELQRRHAKAMRRSSIAAWWLAFAVGLVAVVQIVVQVTGG